MDCRAPLIAVLGLIAALYPLIIYLGIATMGVPALAVILLCVVVLRMTLTRAWKHPRQLPLPMVIVLLCLVAINQNSAETLKYYPVLMNLAFAFIFAGSLSQRRTLIEHIAGRFTDTSKKPPEARRYMRSLTGIWALLLGLNACISAYTACCMTTQAWAVYNGIVAYVLIVFFIAGELVFRHFFRKSLVGRQHPETEPDRN